MALKVVLKCDLRDGNRRPHLSWVCPNYLKVTENRTTLLTIATDQSKLKRVCWARNSERLKMVRLKYDNISYKSRVACQNMREIAHNLWDACSALLLIFVETSHLLITMPLRLSLNLVLHLSWIISVVCSEPRYSRFLLSELIMSNIAVHIFLVDFLW